MNLASHDLAQDNVRRVETAPPLQASEATRAIRIAKAPVQTRTVALVALAVAGGAFGLHAGAAFFIPVVTSVFLAYALAPVVGRLERLHVPRALGAVLAVLLVIAVSAIAVQRTIDS